MRFRPKHTFISEAILGFMLQIDGLTNKGLVAFPILRGCKGRWTITDEGKSFAPEVTKI